MTSSEPNNGEAVTALLDNVLNRTVDWVKYAETKNGVLLALTGASVGWLAAWVSSREAPADWLRSTAAVSLGFLVLSIVVSVSSFLPILDFDLLRLKRKHGNVDSVLYFGSIAGCSSDSYLESVRETLAFESRPATRLEIDYSRQIVINAEIATGKLRMFKYAAWLSLASIIIMAVRILVHLLF